MTVFIVIKNIGEVHLWLYLGETFQRLLTGSGKPTLPVSNSIVAWIERKRKGKAPFLTS